MTGVRPTESVEPAELAAIKKCLDKRRRDHVRVLAMIVVLAHGLRKGELCKLRVADLRMFEGQLCLHSETLKQRSGRLVKRMIPVVAADDIEVLTKYVRQEHGATPDPEAPLFRTAGTRFPFKVGPLTARAVDINLKAALQHAGIKRRITPHSFRHGFATGLLRAGVDIKSVSELLGHSSTSATERYLHTTWEHKVEGLRRLAGS